MGKKQILIKFLLKNWKDQQKWNGMMVYFSSLYLETLECLEKVSTSKIMKEVACTVPLLMKLCKKYQLFIFNEKREDSQKSGYLLCSFINSQTKNFDHSIANFALKDF